MQQTAVDRAKLLHRESIVFDGLMPWGNLDHLYCIQEALQGGLTAANVTVAHFPHNSVRAIDRIAHYASIVRQRRDLMRVVQTTREIEAAKRDGVIGVVWGFQDTTPFDNRLELIDVFADLGVRIVQLTYNTQNFVGCGCCEVWDAPLTGFGREILRRLEDLRIAVDLSHCGDQTTEDTLRRARRPVLITHAGARAVCPAYGRNKTDDQIRMLAGCGGVIGVVFAPFLVKRDPQTHQVLPSTIDDVIRHIEHIGNLVGLDHVGIASDLCAAWLDQRRTPPESSMRWWREARPDVFGRGPIEEYDPYPEGLQRHSHLPNLTRRLIERGFSDGEVRGILGGNFIRVLRDIWGD
ncbi:MAG: membrane dipeptidase [Armatimonadota bacterium]|nr:membrane dipeptidase [Armatimonadota bacterium]